MDHGNLRVFSGTANVDLARRIADELHISLGNITVSRFSDGETRVQINESVRGADCFLIQPTCPPVNDHLMELLVMVDAFKRGSAGRVTAVIPYYGYARQDKKTAGREPITAKLAADLLSTAGVDRMLTVDLHVQQIQGFFDLPVDHLPASPTIARYLKDNGFGGEDTVIVSPDVGAVGMARGYADRLNAGLAIITKRRHRPNESEVQEVIGDLKGKRAILVDDMVDTAGSLVKGAEALVERGAAEVCAAATHGVLSGPAIERLAASPLATTVLTDTIPLSPEKRHDKIIVLSLAPLLANAIDRVHRDDSVSEALADGLPQPAMF